MSSNTRPTKINPNSQNNLDKQEQSWGHHTKNSKIYEKSVVMKIAYLFA
jgi:hypothetical protein